VRRGTGGEEEMRGGLGAGRGTARGWVKGERESGLPVDGGTGAGDSEKGGERGRRRADPLWFIGDAVDLGRVTFGAEVARPASRTSSVQATSISSIKYNLPGASTSYQKKKYIIEAVHATSRN
jgi:hypothetical protein